MNDPRDVPPVKPYTLDPRGMFVENETPTEAAPEGSDILPFWGAEQCDLYPGDEDDAVENVFCPTGPGGGVDPTCSAGGPAAAAHDQAVKDIDKLPKDREHGITIDADTGEVIRRDTGPLPPDYWTTGRGPEVAPPPTGEGRRIIHVHTHMDKLSSFSDGDWAIFAKGDIAKMTVVDRDNVYSIEKETNDTRTSRSKYTPREWREAFGEEMDKAEASSVSLPGQSIDEEVSDMIARANVAMAKRFGVKYTVRKKG